MHLKCYSIYITYLLKTATSINVSLKTQQVHFLDCLKSFGIKIEALLHYYHFSIKVDAEPSVKMNYYLILYWSVQDCAELETVPIQNLLAWTYCGCVISSLPLQRESLEHN